MRREEEEEEEEEEKGGSSTTDKTNIPQARTSQSSNIDR